MSCTGAMYFSIAVILIYGISIAMLVAASTLRRSHSDYELKSFMRSYARLDVERRSREKQRARAVLRRLDRRTAAPTPVTARTSGPGLRRPVGLVWPGRSPPTVNVVDVSAADGDNDGETAVPGAAAIGTDALLHHQHDSQQTQQQQQSPPAPHHVSRLPRHMSERSLLMPKSSSEFDLPEPSRRRSTAV